MHCKMFDMETNPEITARYKDASFEAVGVRIQAVREVAGLTQTQFGDRLGVTYTVVGNWERGESLPRHHTLVSICEDFGVSADFILRGYIKHFSLDQLDRYMPVLEQVNHAREIKSAGKRAREQLKQQLAGG